MFATLLKQELRLGLRQKSDVMLLLAFTLLSALLFPVAIGPEPQLLTRIAPGIIWVLILFAAHIASPNVWRQDVEDGTCEQLSHNSEWLVISKIVSVWVQYFGSLLLLTPFLGLVFGINAWTTLVLTTSLFIASLPLSCLTVTGGLMTQGNNRSAILSSVILLPLYLPLLIFSCASSESAASLQDITAPILMLAGISLLLCPCLLYVCVIILRWHQDC